MGQILLQDNIPTLVVASTTTVTLAATNNGQSTLVSVGAQQYSPSALITLNAATTGANALDTGALAANQTYYVYAIVNQSSFALALVASTSSSAPSMPSGYGTAYTKIGSFTTNASSQISIISLITPPAASSTQDGIVTAGTQTIAGNKTFTGVQTNSNRTVLRNNTFEDYFALTNVGVNTNLFSLTTSSQLGAYITIVYAGVTVGIAGRSGVYTASVVGANTTPTVTAITNAGSALITSSVSGSGPWVVTFTYTGGHATNANSLELSVRVQGASSSLSQNTFGELVYTRLA